MNEFEKVMFRNKQCKNYINPDNPYYLGYQLGLVTVYLLKKKCHFNYFDLNSEWVTKLKLRSNKKFQYKNTKYLLNELLKRVTIVQSIVDLVKINFCYLKFKHQIVLNFRIVPLAKKLEQKFTFINPLWIRLFHPSISCF